jgi:hypothetical protein
LVVIINILYIEKYIDTYMLDEIYNPKPKPSTSNTLKTERNYRGSSIPALDLEGESSGIIGPEIDGIRKIKYR